MSVGKADFEIMNGGEQAVIMIDELAYRLYEKTRSANVEELVKLAPMVAKIAGILILTDDDGDVVRELVTF